MTYDGLVLLAIWMIGTLVVMLFTGGQAVGSGNLIFQFYLLFLGWVYLAWSWKRAGQTLGMRAWKIRIVSNSDSLSWSQTVIRYLVSWISLLLAGAGFLWSLIHPQQATWHDLASQTRLEFIPRK